MRSVRASAKPPRAIRRHPIIESLEPRAMLAVDFDVLVFPRTTGFRHAEAITHGVRAIRDLGAAHNFSVTVTEDPAVFTDAGLDEYEAVVFLQTTGDVLDTAQQAAFERFIQSGHGYVGIHAASDAERSWPWYEGLVGAQFLNHPHIQPATIKVADRVHPATAHLPQNWVRTDEWYDFDVNPRPDVHVLMTLDERSYTVAGASAMGADHPIAWCQNYSGGRSFYTGLGHTNETYAEPAALEHILGGIRYAAGAVPADCTASDFSRSTWSKTVIDADLVNPIGMDIAPDGRVYYIETTGRVRAYDPATASARTLGTIPTTSVNEEGLLGIALDPDFATNQWIYLHYSAVGADEQRLSRFTIVNGGGGGGGDRLDASSEKVLLRIPTQRRECCHSAGALDFGPDGTLYLSTGDNTNPFDSDGYAPIDERPGHEDWDAQRTAANPSDLRGKILRIKPEANGTYTIPTGNLFPANGSQGRPEIYVMGNRNPFRIAVDQETGWLYWGDVGPDAGNDSPTRGPRGYDEINQAKTAGNYGWPYFVADNKPYHDYDFATGASGPAFNPAAPVNDSPNNTGASQLPPAQGAWIWYPYTPDAGEPFAELGPGNRAAMAGPVYHYNASTVAPTGLPAYYDDTLFIHDWARGTIKEVKIVNAPGRMGQDETGGVLKINPFLPHLSFSGPIDLDIGPDGILYVIEYGLGMGGGNLAAQLVRIDYLRDFAPPTAIASADQNAGPAPLSVNFTSAGSQPGDRGPVTYAWDFDADGAIDSTDPHPAFTYTTPGDYAARLIITDTAGASAQQTVSITVGNSPPVVSLVMPPDGSFFTWGQYLPYSVTVTDAEDGTTITGQIPPTHFVVQPMMGHNEHTHPLLEYHGLSGVIPVPSTHGDDTSNLYLVLQARYVDDGGSGSSSPLTGRSTIILNPRRKQAEHFSTSSNVLVTDSNDTAGGGALAVTSPHDGDYISFKPVHLQNIDQLRYRVSSTVPGATVEVRTDSPIGPLLATTQITSTAGAFMTQSQAITDPGGTHELFFVFKGDAAALENLKLNWIEFDRANNTPPAPVAETYKTAPGKPLNVPRPYGLLANDSDAQSDVFFAVVSATPAHGQVTLHPDGSFTYSPTPGYLGADTFTYFAHDGVSGSTPTTVSIDVTQAMGDANLDGRINADDYFRIDQAFLAQPVAPTYEQGDFNYDGIINADDYFLIDQAFLRAAGAPATSTAVSTPTATATTTASSLLPPEEDAPRKRPARPRPSNGRLFSQTRVRRPATRVSR